MPKKLQMEKTDKAKDKLMLDFYYAVLLCGAFASLNGNLTILDREGDETVVTIHTALKPIQLRVPIKRVHQSLMTEQHQLIEGFIKTYVPRQLVK